MKESISFFVPIVQDPMNDITGRCINNHVSTNGYYGYQPVVGKEGGDEPRGQHPAQMEIGGETETQFSSLIESEEPHLAQPNGRVRNDLNRKRTCEHDVDLPDYKKRRENDPLPLIPEQPSNNKCSHVRQPTHNIPDMPRCMMEVLRELNALRQTDTSLEELLRETHGVCLYHWFGHDI